MAIFQVRDLAAARRRVAGLGVRVVWAADLPDIAATHLHPGDVPGAMARPAGQADGPRRLGLPGAGAGSAIAALCCQP
jgi:hypothetical protein